MLDPVIICSKMSMILWFWASCVCVLGWLEIRYVSNWLWSSRHRMQTYQWDIKSWKWQTWRVCHWRPHCLSNIHSRSQQTCRWSWKQKHQWVHSSSLSDPIIRKPCYYFWCLFCCFYLWSFYLFLFTVSLLAIWLPCFNKRELSWVELKPLCLCYSFIVQFLKLSPAHLAVS